MIVNLMRANQRWMMTVIAVLVIVSFLWFFSDRSHYTRAGSDRVGSIYGRSVVNTEFDRAHRQLLTALDLGLKNIAAPDLLRGDLTTVITNQMVLRHEAEALGIAPADNEVEEAVKKIPAFQANGSFDPSKYADFIDKKLGPRGFSDRQIDELVRADLEIGKLRELIDSTVIVSNTEVKTALEQAFGKTEVSVVRWKLADFLAAAAPSDDDIKKQFEQQKERYQHPETRKVQYVVFGLEEEKKKLAGKERVEAMKPFATKTEEFMERVLDAKGAADFPALAKAAGLEVKETPAFEEDAPKGFAESGVPKFAEAAFRLTKEQPTSDAVETPTAYYVLHLTEITPAKPMTLEEARPKIAEALKRERAREALTAKAGELQGQIAAALKAGKLFVDAAKEAGATPEELPAFSLAEPNRNAAPDQQAIEAAAGELPTNELGKAIPTQDGAVVVYVRRREPVDLAKLEDKRLMVTNSLVQRKRQSLFGAWLRESRKAAAVDFGGMPEPEEG